MLFSLSTIVAMAHVLSLATAAPSTPSKDSITKRGFAANSCADGSRAEGLSQADCEHMSSIGMAGQGVNAHSPNGGIWVGNQGPNTFDFQNKCKSDVTVILWNSPPGDFLSSFMNVKCPQISYSLGPGQNITISMENKISASWAGIYDRQTPLSPWGQIMNTWGEVTTGQYGTVDVSRLVHMGGDLMSISGGEEDAKCVSDFDKCVFKCKSGNTCGYGVGEVNLVNCQAGSQPGANFGWRDGNAAGGQPEGGCSPAGLANGNGHVTVTL